MPKKFEIDPACAVLISVILLFALWAAQAVFFAGNVLMYDEDGPIELLQACLLAMASGVWLLTAFQEKRTDRLVVLFCALLCYGFFLRELDVEDFNLPDIVLFMGAGIGRNLSLLFALLAMAIYAALTGLPRHVKTAIGFSRSREGLLLVAGGVCMLLGDAFEKTAAFEHFVFFEEIAELFGYTLILLSALAAHSAPGELEARFQTEGELRAGKA